MAEWERFLGNSSGSLIRKKNYVRSAFTYRSVRPNLFIKYWSSVGHTEFFKHLHDHGSKKFEWQIESAVPRVYYMYCRLEL
jgi:hypothetical protein